MTDAAKTDVQVLIEALLEHGVFTADGPQPMRTYDLHEQYAKVAAAVVANAAPRIRAETVAQVVALDAVTAICRGAAELPYGDSPEGQPNAMIITEDELQNLVERYVESVQEIAAAPPGFVCVPLDKLAVAYGYLWHVQYPPERAAYEARKLLREFLTHEQRGEGINGCRQAMLAESGK